ncbi:MAG TPA: phosphoribosylamine--glycine ligase, partial [Gelria sp.]|nr:phosphoribosylamine--glycine ligase [Gelria sp.]
LDNLDQETIVFHGGTASKDGKLITNGGRVLALTMRGRSMEEAIDRVYREIKKIHFEGMHYRTDIGGKSLR